MATLMFNGKRLMVNPQVTLCEYTKKIGFGNIVTNNLQYPITHSSSIGNSYGDRFFPYIKNYYDEYNNFLFDVHSESSSFLMNKFNTTDDMVNFLNENIEKTNENSVESYYIECYARQINDMNINKIYGLNLFYSILKGKKKYKKKIKTLYSGGYQNDNFDWNGFINMVWSHFTFDGFVSSENINDSAKSIWFPQSHSNIYSLLNKINGKVTISGESERKCFSWGDSSFCNMDGNINTMSVTDSVVIGLRQGTKDMVKFTRLRNMNYFDDYSFVIVYRLDGKNQNGDNFTSLYVKPIGQDTFRLNYMKNIHDKDLYIIYYNGDHDHQPVVKRLDNVMRTNDMIGDISFMVRKSDWCVRPHISNSTNCNHTGFNKMKSFKFFIGDKNGNISNFSSEIIPYVINDKNMTLISNI